MKTHRYTRFATLGGLALGVLLVLGASPARAQSLDSRWLPWVGCWEPVDSASTAAEEGPMVCFRPVAGQEGIEMLTVQGAEIVSHRMIVADGRTRDESQEGCSGTAKAQFSADGQRVFTVADLRCEGGVQRRTTGIMSLTLPDEWLDVKSLDVGGESAPWVERYQLASPARARAVGLADIGTSREMAIRSARMMAIRAIDPQDVIEATKVVDSDAVKAWVAERHDRFGLNADELVRLKKAGVPSGVIDVMVAVSYPQKFAFAGGNPHPEAAPRAVRGARGYYPRSRWRGCDPFFWDPFCFGYGYYGYGYGYSPYSWGYSGWYGGYFGGYGGYGGYTPVIVNPQPTSGYEHGRVVRGQGYTRGASNGGSSSAGPPAVRRSSGRSSTSTASPTRSSTPSARRSSGGSSTGRTAHRRGGGGG